VGYFKNYLVVCVKVLIMFLLNFQQDIL
jgi:hypothetical protein